MNIRSLPAPKRAPRLLPLAGALALASLAPAAFGQGEELARLLPSDAAYSNLAGSAVAIRGDLVVVGSPQADLVATNAGTAAVYRFDGSQWREEQILSAADGVAGDAFGSSVAIGGDAVLVGAPLHDALGTDSGAVYVFRKSSGMWALEKKLLAADGNVGDDFGRSLSADGDLALVGAPRRESGAVSAAGAAYAFEYKNPFVGWSEVQKLSAASPSSSELFGHSVSVRGTHLAVGCPNRVISTYYRGAAFAYEWDSGNWMLLDEIRASDAASGDQFGFSVAIDHPQLVVGAPYDDTGTSNDGSVYFYEDTGSGWNEQKVVSPLVDYFGYFGNSVDLHQGCCVVGALYANVAGSDSGLAHTFHHHKGTWVLDQQLGSTSLSASDRLGTAVALSGTRAVVGASHEDDAFTDAGAAFVHSVNELLLRASDSSPGEGDDLDFSTINGTPGTRCFFTVDQVNGSPFFQILFFSNFASNGEFAFGTTVPPGLGGSEITFRSYRIAAWGKTVGSNFVRIDFE